MGNANRSRERREDPDYIVEDDANTREWLIGKTDFEYCDEFGLHMEVALRRRSYRRQALETRAAVVFEEILPGGYGEERHSAIMNAVREVAGPEADSTALVRAARSCCRSRSHCEVFRCRIAAVAARWRSMMVPEDRMLCAEPQVQGISKKAARGVYTE